MVKINLSQNQSVLHLRSTSGPFHGFFSQSFEHRSFVSSHRQGNCRRECHDFRDQDSFLGGSGKLVLQLFNCLIGMLKMYLDQLCCTGTIKSFHCGYQFFMFREALEIIQFFCLGDTEQHKIG